MLRYIVLLSNLILKYTQIQCVYLRRVYTLKWENTGNVDGIKIVVKKLGGIKEMLSQRLLTLEFL